MFTQDEVKKLLTYDRDSGELRWNGTRRGVIGRNSIAGGEFVGKVNKKTYYRLQIKGYNFFSHRVIWFMETGNWPEEIDHINGDGTDNSWGNLREVSRKENLRNKKLYTVNSSGVSGVCFNNLICKWRAYIQVLGKQKHLGLFVNKEDAVTARRIAEIKYGYHVNHGQDRPL